MTGKDTKGKPQLSWTMRSTMEAIASVREYGNEKYASPDNWKGVPDSAWCDAALRHLMAHIEHRRGNGSKNDDESGLPHLAHCMVSLMFLMENERRRNT